MNETSVLKLAVGSALCAFAFMTFGSLATGARVITALIRGTEATIIFGLIALGLGTYLLAGEEDEGIDNLDAGAEKSAAGEVKTKGPV